MPTPLPVLGVCGYSGAGKTTLIEALIPRLKARGWRVVVIKHDAHGLKVDRPGKDSDRFFRAGADVWLNGPGERCYRLHEEAALDLPALIARLVRRYDLVLVEGHKATPLPAKLWLRRETDDAPPAEMGAPVLDLARETDRVTAVWTWLERWVPSVWLTTPVYAGILIGGRSRRMGRPKHLLRASGGGTWLERVVSVARPCVAETVLLGRGAVPERLKGLVRLPDVPGREGPLAGLLSAMRWQPWVSWLMIACDVPLLSTDALRWLLTTRAPGVWATLPRLQEGAGVEPLPAHYDFRAAALLERGAGPSAIASQPGVFAPTPPAALAEAWRNVNTPEERRRLPGRGASGKRSSGTPLGAG